VSEKMKIDKLKWADAMNMEFHLVPYTNNDLIGVLITTGETSELEKNRRTIDALAEQLGVPARIFKEQEQHCIDEAKYKLHPTDEVDEPVIVKTEVTHG
jgi:hypothetical protein